MTYQEELPADIAKSIRCHLEVHEICQSKDQIRQRHTFGANMIRKDLRVIHVATNVHTKVVEDVEQVERRHSQLTEALPFRVPSKVLDSDRFHNEPDATTSNTGEHTWLATHWIHEHCSNEAEDRRYRYPTGLQKELLRCAIAQCAVERWAVVVDHQNFISLVQDYAEKPFRLTCS